MIEIVGKKYIKSNIENDEFSYKKVLKQIDIKAVFKKKIKENIKI